MSLKPGCLGNACQHKVLAKVAYCFELSALVAYKLVAFIKNGVQVIRGCAGYMGCFLSL